MNIEEIIVMNRNEAVKYAHTQHSEKAMMISISDIGSSTKVMKTAENGIFALLKLQFDDVEDPDINAITEKDADLIAKFVKNNVDKADRIIVHCSAGISRSAGCAAAIMKYLYGDDSKIYDCAKYRPNSTVYRRVLDAMVGKDFPQNLLFEIGVPSPYPADVCGTLIYLMYEILNPNERLILMSRYQEHKTLEESGALIDVTRERVRQIVKTAIGKLKMKKQLLCTGLEYCVKRADERTVIEANMNDFIQKAYEDGYQEALASVKDFVVKESSTSAAIVRQTFLETKEINQPTYAVSLGIEYLDICTRAYNGLKRMGINTICELIEHSPSEILNNKAAFLGAGTVKHICERLSVYLGRLPDVWEFEARRL